MKRLPALAGSIGLLVGLAGLSAQQKPNFAGRWVVVSPAADAGQEQFVTQDAEKLTTAHTSDGDGHGAVYKLDGTESRNVLTSHGQEIISVSKASLNRGRLTIETVTTYPDRRKVQTTEVWSLDAEGRLVIEHTERGPTAAPKTTSLVFKKR